MTRRVDIPSEARVRAALEELQQQASNNGTRPSVLALTRRLGMRNTTFRRHYPDIAREISTLRAEPTDSKDASFPSRFDTLVARNSKLKRRNRELTDHLTLAAARIQRLALENQQLRQELEAAANVTRLNTIPNRRDTERANYRQSSTLTRGILDR
ncbi:hypothetical protein OHB49_13630 [Streptomyces sp. NBC_01717]|uniref:hypothetical protein n=1 Tax=Streptomyces sp. NBC_01717 TaxID=2975918 RepID=UPI002E316816|nr:hypothetical protein [Streptomyces sp. NBC_01717]